MKVLCLALISFLTLFGSGAVSAEQQVEQAKPPAAKGPAALDPAVMEKMKALMSPGAQHKALEQFAGNWNYAGKFWMSPDAPPQESTGTSKNTMIYGGRFLKQEVSGPWMGETFEGLGYTGYDNMKQEYATVWLDSMMTGIMTSSGEYDEATKTLKQTGSGSCPLTGQKDMKMRSEWTIKDPNTAVYTSYATGADGKEYKGMELTYTRA